MFLCLCFYVYASYGVSRFFSLFFLVLDSDGFFVIFRSKLYFCTFRRGRRRIFYSEFEEVYGTVLRP